MREGVLDPGGGCLCCCAITKWMSGEFVCVKAFWILVEDVDSEVILHHEFFLLKS